MRRQLRCGIIAFAIALAWRVSLGAQDAEFPVVGVIFDSEESNLVNRSVVATLRESLAERGRVDGKNIDLRFEYTDAFGDYQPRRLETLVDDDAAILSSTSNDATLAILEGGFGMPALMAQNFGAVTS